MIDKPNIVVSCIEHTEAKNINNYVELNTFLDMIKNYHK